MPRVPKGVAHKRSGRPPGEHGAKQSINARVTPQVAEYVQTHSDGASKLIDDTFRRTTGFRDWLQAHIATK